MKMKKIYHRLPLYLILLCVMSYLAVPHGVSAAEKEENISKEDINKEENISTVSTQPYNIMLLIDKSGSMNSTDEQRLALSAACQFVDQLSTTYGDKVLTMQIGALAFSQTTEEIASLSDLKSEENMQRLKEGIHAVQYRASGTGGTDLSVALRDAAVRLEENGVKDGRNAIVLFTDGYSDNVLDAEASKKALKEAYRKAAKLNCEIYVVGLNQGNYIQEKGREEIFRIADTAQTGEGLMPREEADAFSESEFVNYLITDNMNEVREFYIALYAHMFESEWEFVDNHEFEIETGGVLEANITVYSDTEITDVKVQNPAEETMQEDGSSYFVSGDAFYKVIRIINPEKGFWNVYVTSHDDSYKTYVVRFYGIEAAVEASCGEASQFPDSGLLTEMVGQVVVTPVFRDEPYVDEDFAEGVYIKKFTVEHNGNSRKYNLKYEKETGTFKGYFPVEEDGKYHITATIEDDNMSRTVECEVTAEIPEPIQTFRTDIGAFELEKEEKQTVNAGALAGVKDLEIQTVSVEPLLNDGKKQEIVSAEVSETKSELVITGINKGKGILKVTAVDGGRNEYTLTGRITVNGGIPWKIIGIAAGGAAVLILAVVLIVLFVKKRK